jgi:SAM-dependent methyltransferase
LRRNGLRIAKNTDEVGWLKYSEGAFTNWKPLTRRIDFLVNTLDNQIEDSKAKILVLGPRFECEIYGYLSLGIKKNNLFAVDTFSYSPLIQCGNMHNLSEFPNEKFDIVIAGWTIVYAENPVTVIKEFSRVLKPSGKIILTWDSPSNVLFSHQKELFFENTSEIKYQVIDLVDSSSILSWAVTRPSYNDGVQVITLVFGKQ